MEEKRAERHQSEVEALRDRLARLSEASVRVSESLDLGDVLKEVVGSARVLTNARFGSITTEDESGEIEEFVTSGLSPEEERRVMEFPGARQLYEVLRVAPRPLRISDLSAYLQSHGLPDVLGPYKAFMATPMRRRGMYVGNFCLAEKEGADGFTPADEEVLELFASQAATAIDNARAHRAERHARADLEALVDTAPVGVLVFDAQTGRLVSANREVKRIAGGLSMQGRTLEQLLEVLSIHRADGRQISLEELPVIEMLRDANSVRAEEIVIEVPDGRSVTTVVNATPIHSESGATVSVIVTVQDMTPLEEIERLRAEFLSVVSHELRLPLAAVRGCTATVLGSVPAPDPAELLQYFRIIDGQARHMHDLIGDLLDAGRIETGGLSVDPQPEDVSGLLEEARRAFLGASGAHSLAFDVEPNLPPVLADRRRIIQVLTNLLSNASRYSPDGSQIGISASRDGDYVALSVADEGRGVPVDKLPHIFRKFFRAGREETGRGLRGTGLGLAICKGLVEAHGGRIHAESAGPEAGMRITFRIPIARKDGDDAMAELKPLVSRTHERDGERTRVLVVDDDPQMLRFIRQTLERTGFAAVLTGDPQEVRHLIETNRPAVVLLDLMLPGCDGIELMERVPVLADLPVIFLSAYAREETIERALESGADDYIVKPFSATELVARVRAAMRRSRGPRASYRRGDLLINYEERRVSLRGQQIGLTVTEYDLLRELSMHAGQVLTRENLLRRVWGKDGPGNYSLVRSFVKKLRRKLGDEADRPAYIVTEPGVGYRMLRDRE